MDKLKLKKIIDELLSELIKKYNYDYIFTIKNIDIEFIETNKINPNKVEDIILNNMFKDYKI